MVYGHICLFESQPLELFTEEMDTHLNFLLPRLNTLTTLEAKQHDCLFLVSNRGQAIWPTSSLVHVKPLAMSLHLKINQFDFALCETMGTHMYVTYWLGPTTSQWPISFDTIHSWKSNHLTVATLLKSLRVVNQFYHHFKELLALHTYVKVKQFDCSLFRVLATQYDWDQQFDKLIL